MLIYFHKERIDKNILLILQGLISFFKMIADKQSSAEKLEAKRSSAHDMVDDGNNVSAVNLLQDESIFNEAEVLLFSQRKNGKSGDECVF